MAVKKVEEIAFNMRLLGIKVVQFSQFDVSTDYDKNAYPLVEYQSDFNFNVVENEDRVVCTIVVTIRIIETQENFAQLTTEFNFEVLPLDKLVVKRDNVVDINNNLLYTVGSIAISTVRGILVEKLRGSIIQNDVYPLMDLVQLFQQSNQVK
jgi:hypothetical protein